REVRSLPALTQPGSPKALPALTQPGWRQEVRGTRYAVPGSRSLTLLLGTLYRVPCTHFPPGADDPVQPGSPRTKTAGQGLGRRAAHWICAPSGRPLGRGGVL